MPNLYSPLIYLLLFVHLCHSSGHLELTIKSPWIQQAAVGLYQPSAPFGNIHSLILHGNEQQTLRFPVNFTENAKVVITVGGSPNFGLQNSRFETVVVPENGKVLTPEDVPAPFNAFRIAFECDANFHGEHCAQMCNEQVAEQYGKRCNTAGFPSCPRGFMGRECTDPIRQELCPCKNGGQCATSFLSNSQEVPLCECPRGFFGPICQSEKTVEKVEIKTEYTPELRYVPQIIAKHYESMKMRNELIASVKKRVNISVDRSRRRMV
uniref:Delta-like protein n=1 Tax=Caenorhabditis japonica TaxID=281687 RepID=A0A8R1I8C4_CAEJA